MGQDGLADVIGGEIQEIRQLGLLRREGVDGFNAWRETSHEEVYFPAALLGSQGFPE